MKTAHPLIELQHCSLILDEQRILDDVNFALHEGERWAVVGPNGSGKTMLLKMLRGDVWPTPTGRERRRYALRDRRGSTLADSKQLIAYIGPERQDKYVRYGWNLTVEQVVTTGLFDEDIPLTRPSAGQRARVGRMLRRFSLSALRHRHILTLSYGQRRLVLVARAFAGNARLLLLDEVFNGLDTSARKKLRTALERPRGGHAWLMTTHRREELPANVTNIARMEAGRLVGQGRGGGAWDSGQRGSKGGTIVSTRAAASTVGKRAFDLPSKSRVPGPAAATRPLIIIRNTTLYRDYRLVIRDLNWTIERGQHWAILGANGSGKSTLLSLIYGDLHPALGGTIQRDGVPFGTRIERWKHRVGWVSPELQADHYLARSIEEIVISGRYASVGLNEAPTRTDAKAATRWLKFFGIEALQGRKPRQVSYGQMRLTLLARAMMNDPELLLLDEPCTGLDAEARTHVLALLQQLAQRGVQLLMAVHHTQDIVPAVTRILKIERGGKVSVKR